MRPCRFVLFAFAVSAILARAPLVAQTTQQIKTTVQRDSQAVTLLQRSVVALGGAVFYSSSSGVIARGTLTAAPGGISGSILWENQGSEFRFERPGPNGSIVFVSGHGDPALIDGSSVQRNIYHLAMSTPPPHLPVLCLLNAINSTFVKISAVQQVTLNQGSPTLKVSLIDETDEITSAVTQQDWYLDPNTLLPVRLDFVTGEMHNALNTAKMSYVFSNYKNVSGVMIPLSVVMFADGQQIANITFTSVEIGASILSTDFDAPASTGVAK